MNRYFFNHYGKALSLCGKKGDEGEMRTWEIE